MSAKTVFPCALVLALLGLGAARAQDAAAPPGGMNAYPAPPPATGPAVGEAAPPANGAVPGKLSTWMLYPRSGCCGPLGDPPIATELFLRIGPSLPVEGDVFGGTLKTGWEIQGGARVLFLDRPLDAAWFLDLSLSNTYNQGRNPDINFPLVTRNPNLDTTQPFDPVTNPEFVTQQVTIRNLNRTYANFGLGREWYWSMPALAPRAKLRFGADTGFRYGTARLELFEIQHRNDIVYGFWLALSTDWEIPRGCCTWLFGFRAEYDYTWTNILPPNDTDLQDVNLLITGGVRF